MAELCYALAKKKGATATGKQNSDGLLVLKGSQAVLKEADGIRTAFPSRLVQRDALIQDGTLKKEDSFYVFTKDHQFTSASSAACVILGTSANGNVAWRNNDGTTLKELHIRPRARKSIPKSAHSKHAKAKRKYEVKAELTTHQLAKAGASLGLKISCDGKMLGTLKVGRGSLSWKGAGGKKFKRRIPWESFAKLLNDYSR